jgi:hypothetical protein
MYMLSVVEKKPHSPKTMKFSVPYGGQGLVLLVVQPVELLTPHFYALKLSSVPSKWT